jgi:uncharacterized membrane protein
VSKVYEVTLPADVNALLESLSGIITLGISGVATTPLECMGLEGYMYQLLFWMILPLAIVLVVLMAVIISVMLKKRRLAKRAATKASKHELRSTSHMTAFHLADLSEPIAPPSLVEQTLPAVLTALFFVYPVVTKQAFDGFMCYWFEDDAHGWLRSDVSIKCDTPEHATVMSIAWTAVFICAVARPRIKVNASADDCASRCHRRPDWHLGWLFLPAVEGVGSNRRR